MRLWLDEPPLVIVAGDGNHLVDQHGRRYLDGVSSLWANVHGHRKRELDDAIRAQLDRIAHTTLLGLAGGPAAELAGRLVAVAPPGLERVFYSDNGSTAVEVALKLAYQYHQHRGRPGKQSFASLRHAYHGDTLGAVSVGGIDLFHAAFGPLLFPAHHIEPDPEARALGDLLATHADSIAALIVEPLVQGAAGMLLQPRGFLSAAARRCREHDVLLIVDEVATGFGRTGTLFASQQEGVTPDLMCLAKGLTGGYLPLAATLATGEVFDAFLGNSDERRTFFHGHTFTGNALACAVALASLDLFEREQVIERIQPLIKQARAQLSSNVAPLPHVREIRQCGLMIGIELCADPATGAAYAPDLRMGARVCKAIRELGVILRPLGDVVVLMPPLSISAGELEQLIHATAQAIAAVTR
jgi:adenosylmethionine-8-amino-7-oxononanoate aminotransferase